MCVCGSKLGNLVFFFYFFELAARHGIRLGFLPCMYVCMYVLFFVCLFVFKRVLVWGKNPQPSNVSGIDGRTSTISKNLPEGNITLLGQTRYYAPEETSQFVSVGGSTYNSHIVTKSRSPRHPHVLFLALYIHILAPSWFYVNVFISFANSPSRFFAVSLAHRSYQPYNPLPSLLQRVFLRSPSPVPPTLRPHSLSTQSQYSLHYSFLFFH